MLVWREDLNIEKKEKICKNKTISDTQREQIYNLGIAFEE